MRGSPELRQHYLAGCRHWLARMLSLAFATVSAIRAARVSGFRAEVIHSRIPRFTERGKASKLFSAVLSFPTPSGGLPACPVLRHHRVLTICRWPLPWRRRRARGMHAGLSDQPLDDRLVDGGPRAFWLTWCDQQHGAFVIELSWQAVDPAMGNEGFENVLAPHMLPARALLVGDEPHRIGLRVVRPQPTHKLVCRRDLDVRQSVELWHGSGQRFD